MKLLNAEQAEVPQDKITEYLLSTTHSVGKHKAAFFLNFGFTVENWEIMAQSLIKHAIENEVVNERESPDERNPNVQSVWFIDEGNDSPRLVTAYPRKD